MNLGAIREALAAKAKAYIAGTLPNIDVSGYANMQTGVTVQIVPGDPYVVYFDPSPSSSTTMGANGNCDVYLTAVVFIPHVAGMPEEAQKVADVLLSVGDSNGGSLVDALMEPDDGRRRTLGGLISELIVRQASATPMTNGDTPVGVQVLIPMQLAAPKNGAQT